MKENFVFHHVKTTPDLQVGLHCQPSWELSGVIRGAGRRVIGGKTADFSAGDLVLIPPKVRHAWYFDHVDDLEIREIENVSLMFSMEFLNKLMSVFPDCTPLQALNALTNPIEFNSDARQRIWRLIMLLCSAGKAAQIPLVIDVLLTIGSNLPSTIPIQTENQATLQEQRLRQIEIFTACNYARKLRIRELSNHLGMYESSFCSFFRKAKGMSYMTYLNQFRISHAKFLLETEPEEPIFSIAVRCGFETISHFNHLFKEQYGCSPKECFLTVREVYGWRACEVSRVLDPV